MVLGAASKISNWATNTKRIKRPLKDEPSPIMVDKNLAFLQPHNPIPKWLTLLSSFLGEDQFLIIQKSNRKSGITV